MQVLQGRAAQHVAGQREAAADCGVRPRSRCRIPVVVTKLPACNSPRAPRSAPCSVRATPTSCPHRALKTLQYELADGCGARATDATDSLLVVNAKAIGLVISETFLVRGPLLTLLTFYAPRSGLRVIAAAIWASALPGRLRAKSLRAANAPIADAAGERRTATAPSERRADGNCDRARKRIGLPGHTCVSASRAVKLISEIDSSGARP